MTALAVSTPRTAGQVSVFFSHGNNIDVSFMQPKVEFGAACLAKSSFDDYRSFDNRRGRNYTNRIVGDALTVSDAADVRYRE